MRQSGSTSFELAHENGGGLGGLLNFLEGVAVRAGGSEVVGEKIGVSGDDAEEIVESVGDDLIF